MHSAPPIQLQANANIEETTENKRRGERVDRNRFDASFYAKDIVQINATIIAGALVLLTINTVTDMTQGALNRYAITVTTIVSIMPFAFSSMLAFNSRQLQAAKQLTGYGFVVLMLALSVLGILVAIDQTRANLASLEQ